MALDRKDVPAKYKWDLTVIYKTEADFNADLKLAEQMAKEAEAFEKVPEAILESRIPNVRTAED